MIEDFMLEDATQQQAKLWRHLWPERRANEVFNSWVILALMQRLADSGFVQVDGERFMAAVNRSMFEPVFNRPRYGFYKRIHGVHQPFPGFVEAEVPQIAMRGSHSGSAIEPQISYYSDSDTVIDIHISSEDLNDKLIRDIYIVNSGFADEGESRYGGMLFWVGVMPTKSDARLKKEMEINSFAADWNLASWQAGSIHLLYTPIFTAIQDDDKDQLQVAV